MTLKNESVSIPGSKPQVPFLQRPAVVVGAITLLGLILRLLFLSSPALWIDEAAAYRRVSGSFSEMIESLRETGFTPLHYFLYWIISRFSTMPPYMMRLPTALAGAAMVPAAYWVAVQITSRPAAYLSALLTATSAYLLNYSRDAKMYIECWLFVSLNMACLFWWLKSNRCSAWFCWLLTSLIMVGFHATAALIVPTQIIVLITHSKPRVLRSLLFVLGLAISLGAMVAFYKLFNHYYDRTRENWGESGLSWIEFFTGNQDGFELLRGTVTHYLFGWEWPAAYERIRFEPTTLQQLKIGVTTFFTLIGLGVIPWRKLPENQLHWRTMLWIGTWMAIPVYATYCTSAPERMAPWQWFTWDFIYPWFAGGWAVAILVQFFRINVWRERWMNLLKAFVVSMTILLTCAIVYWIVPQQPSSVWRPRYIAVIWPAIAIAISVLLLRLPTRPLRGLVIYSFIGVNLFRHSTFIFFGSEPPTEQIARDILEARDNQVQTYVSRYCATRFQFGPHDQFFTPTLPYYLYALSGTPTSPQTYNFDWNTRFPIRITRGSAIQYVASDLRTDSKLKKVIIWDMPQEEETDLLTSQFSQWKLESQQQFMLWDRWHWWKNDLWERRIYVKQG